jgi:hypothetical protein
MIVEEAVRSYRNDMTTEVSRRFEEAKKKFENEKAKEKKETLEKLLKDLPGILQRELSDKEKLTFEKAFSEACNRSMSLHDCIECAMEKMNLELDELAMKPFSEALNEILKKG